MIAKLSGFKMNFVLTCSLALSLDSEAQVAVPHSVPSALLQV